MPDVGIIGYGGFVGSAFHKAFSQDKNYAVTGIDRANYHSIAGKHFDILVNANGNSSKRLAESEPGKDFEMNVTATFRMLADFPCGHYIHLSSSEVYNDRSRPESTLEDAQIDPLRLSNYGFSKYCGELVARKYAKKWLILRLAGMVGGNMAKGPAYDMLAFGKLFISRKSRLHFMNTAAVASIAKNLAAAGKWNGIYNLVARDPITLEEFASAAKVKLSSDGEKIECLHISSAKLEGFCKVPSSLETVKDFVKKEWRAKILEE